MTKFIIKRTGALGDVVLTTPIARHLRYLFPKAHITIATNSPQAYLFNRDVNAVASSDFFDTGSRLINLDMAYENSPKSHIIDAYAMEAFGTTDIDKRTIMCQPYSYDDDIAQRLSTIGVDPSNTVVIHAAKSWENRTLPNEYWTRIVEELSQMYTVIMVGSGSDFSMTKQNVFDFKNDLSLHGLRALMMECRAFIGVDSGLLHVAGTTSTKVIGIFTCAKYEFRKPLHRKIYYYECPLPCYGCLHEQKPPVTFVGCPINTFECVRKFNTSEFIEKSMAWLEK